MEYRQLGRSGLQVSVVSLGTNQFGNPVDQAGTTSIMDAALEAGMNFVDTADMYGGGQSEKLIGEAIKARRHDWVVMTKFGAMQMKDGPNARGNSRSNVRRALTVALKNLQTDYIDVWMFHRPDSVTPMEEQMSVMNDLVQEGLIRYPGCSNWAAWQIAAGNETAARHGWAPLVAAQPAYSLMNRAVESDLEACRYYGLGLTTYSVLAGGFLTGKHKRGQGALEGTRVARNPRANETLLTDADFDKLEAWEKIAADAGITMTQLAVGWVAAQNPVASVICGATGPDQVRETAAVSDVLSKITPDVLAAINAAGK